MLAAVGELGRGLLTRRLGHLLHGREDVVLTLAAFGHTSLENLGLLGVGRGVLGHSTSASVRMLSSRHLLSSPGDPCGIPPWSVCPARGRCQPFHVRCCHSIHVGANLCNVTRVPIVAAIGGRILVGKTGGQWVRALVVIQAVRLVDVADAPTPLVVA